MGREWWDSLACQWVGDLDDDGDDALVGVFLWQVLGSTVHVHANIYARPIGRHRAARRGESLGWIAFAIFLTKICCVGDEREAIVVKYTSGLVQCIRSGRIAHGAAIVAVGKHRLLRLTTSRQHFGDGIVGDGK
jgi:hypothetical protein